MPTFHLIPHTHWDREWYLTRAGFQTRLVPAIGGLLDLLEREPAARFTLDGQTVLVGDVLAIHPEWRPRLLRAVRAGQLAVGPWYVLADERIPAGESLLRNLLLGRADAEALGGGLDVCYSPDAFGHPAALPLVAREFGLAVGIAWRGIPALPGGGDLARWTGTAGASLLLYHLPPSGYEIGADLFDLDRIPERWPPLRAALAARAASDQIAVFVGADHHAPPPSLVALRDAVARATPDASVRLSTAAEFFAAIAPRTGLPALDGAQRWSAGYTWSLQGTLSARARLARRHAAAELHLTRKSEPLAALAALHGLDPRRGLLGRAWRSLIESQFHDTLCGCCADGVAEEQALRLRDVATMSAEIARGALDELTGHDPDLARRIPERATPTLLLWNPQPTAREDIVLAEITLFREDVLVGPPGGRIARTDAPPAAFALRDEAGVLHEVQSLGVRPGLERLDAPRHYPDQDAVDRHLVALRTPRIGPLGHRTLRLVPGPPFAAARPDGVVVTATTLRAGRRRVTLHDDGTLTLENGADVRTAPLLALMRVADHGDGYTPSFVGDERPVPLRVLGREVLAAGPFVGALALRWHAEGIGTGRLVVVLHADGGPVRCRLELEHAGRDHRLRWRFPFPAITAAWAGVAFGHERRDPLTLDPRAFPAEHPLSTAPAHRWIAVGDAARHLALFVPGCVEYAWDHRALSLTLLRAVGELSRGDLVERPGHAGWPTPTPGAQEPGRHVIEIALDLADGAPDPLALERRWEAVFLPVQHTWRRAFTGVPVASEGLALEGEGLVLSACKPADDGDGVILRCRNVREHEVAGAWRLPVEITEAILARADESALAPIALQDRRNVPFRVAAGDLASIRVRR